MPDPNTPLELHISHAVLKSEIDNLKLEVQALTKTINELLALKHKGLGVLWLASLIVTASFAALVSGISGWLRGH